MIQHLFIPNENFLNWVVKVGFGVGKDMCGYIRYIMTPESNIG